MMNVNGISSEYPVDDEVVDANITELDKADEVDSRTVIPNALGFTKDCFQIQRKSDNSNDDIKAWRFTSDYVNFIPSWLSERAIFEIHKSLDDNDQIVMIIKPNDSEHYFKVCFNDRIVYDKNNGTLSSISILNDVQFSNTYYIAHVSPIGALMDALNDDFGYLWSWHCNITVAAMDEGMEHVAANRAAHRFLSDLLGVKPYRDHQFMKEFYAKKD